MVREYRQASRWQALFPGGEKGGTTCEPRINFLRTLCSLSGWILLCRGSTFTLDYLLKKRLGNRMWVAVRSCPRLPATLEANVAHVGWFKACFTEEATLATMQASSKCCGRKTKDILDGQIN